MPPKRDRDNAPARGVKTWASVFTAFLTPPMISAVKESASIAAFFTGSADNFVVAQLERCETTQRWHLQGYVEFGRRTVLPGGLQRQIFPGECPFPNVAADEWRRFVGSVHTQLRKGSQEQAIRYCEKDETADALALWDGERPPDGFPPFIRYRSEAQPRETHQGRRTDLADLVAVLSDGATVPGGMLFAMREALLGEYRVTASRSMTWLKMAARCLEGEAVAETRPYRMKQVFLFHGPTGTGKTTLIQATLNRLGIAAYDGPMLQGGSTYWWERYEGHGIVILDDMKGADKIENALVLFGRAAGQDLPVKGGSVPPRFTMVLVASNTHPKDWYPGADAAHVLALRRRFDHGISDFDPYSGSLGTTIEVTSVGDADAAVAKFLEGWSVYHLVTYYAHIANRVAVANYMTSHEEEELGFFGYPVADFPPFTRADDDEEGFWHLVPSAST